MCHYMQHLVRLVTRAADSPVVSSMLLLGERGLDGKRYCQKALQTNMVGGAGGS